MNNEEKILLMLGNLTTDVSEIKRDIAELKEDIAAVKEDVAAVKEDIEVIKEDGAITRESTEMLLEWATVMNHVALEETRKQRIAKASVE